MVGISLIFLSIDLLGGVWSLLSLVFAPPPFDPLAAVSYSSVVVLEVGIFLLAAVLNPRYCRRERERGRKEATGAAAEEEALQPEGEQGKAVEEQKQLSMTGADARVALGDEAADIRSSREQTEHEGGFGWIAREDQDVEQALEHGLRRIRSNRSGTRGIMP